MLGGALILVSTAIGRLCDEPIGARVVQRPRPQAKAPLFAIAAAFEDAQYAVYSLSVSALSALAFCSMVWPWYEQNVPKGAWMDGDSFGGRRIGGRNRANPGRTFARGTEIFFVLFSLLSTVWVFLIGVLMVRRSSKD